MGCTRDRYLEVFNRLLSAFGPQAWWPADTPFEVMVGAILTQNTAWTNVERAISNLKSVGSFEPKGLLQMPDDDLAAAIRPAGYYNLKARRLKAFLEYFVGRYAGCPDRMQAVPVARLRLELLDVNGVGPETADSMLLYALGKRAFVVDAYTRRIFSRLGLVDADVDYCDLQARFVRHLPQTAQVYNEYHALIVVLGKDVCRPKPYCNRCPLLEMCLWASKSEMLRSGG